MYRFRALAYHAPSPRGGITEYLRQLRVEALGELARELSKKREVWTVRAVSPPADEAARALEVNLERYVEAFYEAARVVAGYVAFPLRSLDPVLLVELMASYDRAYFSVTYAADQESSIVKALRLIPEKVSISAGSRFAVAFGRIPVTAYFPVTTSREEGVTLSLLYPNHLAERLERGETLPDAIRSTVQDAYELAREALKASGVQLRLLGVDLSLSPWDRESVASLLEKLTGRRLFSPGTLGAIYYVSEALTSLAPAFGGVGFNEVMLPLAEDARLKELALAGELKLRDLIAASFACVAGLDMVPIPEAVEDTLLKGVMRDLAAAQAIKGKPLGLRLILVDAEPGAEVDLGFFGKTPVLDPHS